MSDRPRTDDKSMTGASGQRWEPADEGIILEADDRIGAKNEAPPLRQEIRDVPVDEADLRPAVAPAALRPKQD